MNRALELKQHRSRLDAVFERVNHLPEDDLSLRSDFAAYLTVLIYGFLEQSVRLLIMTYVSNASSQPVAAYVDRRLAYGRSMKYSNLLDLLGDFDQRWRDDYDTLMEERSKNAITTVTNNRNRIAHGNWTTTTIAVAQDNYQQIKTSIEKLGTILGVPNS